MTDSDRLSPEDFSDLFDRTRDSLRILEEAERSAKQLEGEVREASIYVAVCGAEIAVPEFTVVDDVCWVRKVTNPPGVIHVARAADLAQTDYLGVSRYASGVRGEVLVDTEATEGLEPLSVAWHTAALMKLRSQPKMFCPAVADSSWDTIAATDDHSVRFVLLDDVPRQIAPSSGSNLLAANVLNGVRENWDSALDLRASRRFGLAFNLAYVWNQTSRGRVAMANLWAGLEALFGKRSDRPVKQTLVNRITDWSPSIESDTIYALYESRCDVMHGRWLDPEEILTAVSEAHTVLRTVLIDSIDQGEVPLPDWGEG